MLKLLRPLSNERTVASEVGVRNGGAAGLGCKVEGEGDWSVLVAVAALSDGRGRDDSLIPCQECQAPPAACSLQNLSHTAHRQRFSFSVAQ